MNIIICGGGAVGYHLAKMLASEAHNIFLIDENKDRLGYIQSHIDVYGIVGSAQSIAILKEAKVDKCDLLIAVTSSEETNLLVSILGKKFGAGRTIARISNIELLEQENTEMLRSLGVDTIISPVQLATEEILRLVRHSAFTDNFAFDDGQLTLFGISLTSKSPLTDKSVRQSAHMNPDLSFKPVAIHRNEDTIMVNGDTILKEGDIVYFIAVPETIDAIIDLCGQKEQPIRNVMILGGSDIGVLTASYLEKDYKVTLVEKDRDQCQAIADKLKKTLVINLDGRDVEALEQEGLEHMDAFISVTADSETNIISSLVAKNHGVKKTIARVENIDYIHLSQNVGIDTLINKKIIAAADIFKYVRKGEVDAIASLHGVEAEIIEFNVTEGCLATKGKVCDLDFPSTANIAGVIRDGKGMIPFGDFELQAGDKAVVFSETSTIHKIEKYFQVS